MDIHMAVCKYSTLVPPLVPAGTVLCPVVLHWCPRTIPGPAGAPGGAPECAPARKGRDKATRLCSRLCSSIEVLVDDCFKVMKQYT